MTRRAFNSTLPAPSAWGIQSRGRRAVTAVTGEGAKVNPRRPRPKTARVTDIPKRVREALQERSGGVCEACQRHPAVHAHHRKLRRFGDHTLANLLATCLPCHARIHHDPALSYRLGLLLFSYENPATKKAHRWGEA